jgi:carbon storage regulator
MYGAIMVGDNVAIMIVGIRRNEIQLGINAPKSVPVYRKEVYGRICRERDGRGSQYLPSYRRSACAVAMLTKGHGCPNINLKSEKHLEI